jgi:hypothetical protein
MEFFRAKLSGIQFIERLDDRNCVSDFGQWTAPKRMDVVDWRDWTPALVVKERAARRFLSPTLYILETRLLNALAIQFGGAKRPD